MSVYGFLLLLAVAILARFVGNKLVAIVMPAGRFKTTLIGLAGGLIGSLSFKQCQVGDWALVAKINLVGAFIGATILMLLLGLVPFLKILLGRV